MTTDPFTWLINKILEALDARTRIKVLVHEAFFSGEQEPYYFVKIINLSPKVTFTVTHIWVKDNHKELDILNPQTPLPHKLEISDIWETWFPKNIIKDQNAIFNNVFIVLSNGKKYASQKNNSVRPIGFIAK